jgi:protein arginine N-methyltransferase 1
MLPARVESYIVPVEALGAHGQVERGEYQGGRDSQSLEEALRRRGVENRFDLYYDVILPNRGHLATPRVQRLYLLDEDDEPTYSVLSTYAVSRDGVFTGFKGFFIATLSPTVALDISSDDIKSRMTSDSWKHCYLPIENPVGVQQGDRIQLVLSRAYSDNGRLFEQRYRWEGRVARGSTVIARFRQDTRPPG